MKRVVTFIYICLSLFSCSQKQHEIQYHENGKLKLKVRLVNGKREGLLFLYDKNGIIDSKSEWKNGLVNGLSEHYFETGNLKEKTFWHNGKVEGLSKRYHENGMIFSEANYKEGKQVGEAIFHYESGKLMEVQLFNNGDLSYFKRYDEDGKIQVEAVVPIFSEEKDTVELGEDYTVEISFGVILKGKARILTGTFNKSDYLTDTTAVLESENNVFKYSMKADKIGKNAFPILIEYRSEEYDTLPIHGTVVKHPYYVKE